MKKVFVTMAALAVAATGVFASMALATTNDSKAPKVFVCKYVGTPGPNERLQTGGNPINVSANSIKEWNGENPGNLIGLEFADKHGFSRVIAIDTGQKEPSCPGLPPLLFDLFACVDGAVAKVETGIAQEDVAEYIAKYAANGMTVTTDPDTLTCGTTPPPPPPLCPDGKPPTPGEGAFDPNDDCKRPPVTPPVTPEPPVTPPVEPPVVVPPVVVPPVTPENPVTPEEPVVTPEEPVTPERPTTQPTDKPSKAPQEAPATS